MTRHTAICSIAIVRQSAKRDA